MQGMSSLECLPFSALALVLSLACLLSESPCLIARTNATSSPSSRSDPEVVVRLYGSPAVSDWALRSAETEAASLLRSASINLFWADCTAYVPSESCHLPTSSTDLIIRFLAKSLPRVSTSALGIAGSSDGSSVAFVFCDRIFAMRSHTKVVPLILGQVIAHEIVHLLLPEEQHSPRGLMRGQWAAQDLSFSNSMSLGLPAGSVLLLQEEARRRALRDIEIARR